MQTIPQKITGISHPLVQDMYLKPGFDEKHRERNTLIIETKLENANGHEDFDSYLIDLLTDLNDLQAKAKSEVGDFSHVDIRTH